MRLRAMRMILVGAAAAMTAGCVSDGYHGGGGPYGGYAYDGGDWAGERRAYGGDLRGPGVPLLDPWLTETEEGRAIVTVGFYDSAEGFVSEEIAHRANIWFRRYADHDRDMRITDPEIRTALVAAAGRYVR
ncbi:hypothetical protein [Sphingosinicella terrae]|uniref:hypothetical protein n=1 Tax=Sphingosinicella terrae TaxID=2172047 RepID=UPI000E0DBEAC|nr:hypothetical protein [Sphingosinicella terrae]